MCATHVANRISATITQTSRLCVYDVFVEISAAFATLSDGDKRANYNAYGHEDGANAAAAAQQGDAGGRHMYGGQYMTPEDLFEMFFSSDGGFTRARRGGGVQFYRYALVV